MVDGKGLVKTGPVSKIEKGGKQVIEHLIELARTTDLSHAGMAKRINEIYNIDISRFNVEIFFKSNAKITQQYMDNRHNLAVLRAKLTMDYSEQLVTDIRDLNKGIEELKGDEGNLLEVDKKWKQIGDLVDKKGKLLLRAAKLSGKFVEKTGTTNIVDKMQVNIVQQVSEEQSDVIRQLKKFEVKKQEEIIDIKSNENKKTNP